MWQDGCHCSAAGAGVECNHFVLSVVPGVLKTFWDVKGFSYIFIGNRVSREVTQAPEVVLVLPSQGALAEEAAVSLYLVWWKSG